MLKLIANYFTFSDTENIELGIPQGRILGPLLLTIFIYDKPLLLKLFCIMFADNTTFFKVSKTSKEPIQSLVQSFDLHLKPLLDWCYFNRLDINWKKTKFMFVASRRVVFPVSIIVEREKVEVVTCVFLNFLILILQMIVFLLIIF